MDDATTESYLKLLAEHERDLAGYVYSLVSSRADGDEILQEARVVMWKKFSDFETGTNFVAWGKKICLGLVLNFRRSGKRKPVTPVDAEFIEAVAAEIDRIDARVATDERKEALETCLRKLPATHRQMVLWRYYQDWDIDRIASESRRSQAAVYRMLSRVRKVLQDCIEGELKGVGHGMG